MKSARLHKSKSGTINLGADVRKKSSRETFRGDRLLLKRVSVAEGAVICSMACRTQKSGDNPHLCQRVEDNAFHLRNASRPGGYIRRPLSARSLHATFASYREKN